jgi:glycosyltransferase involved in cell wall biosynthesis
MRVAFFLSGLGSGGIYNQTLGVIKLIKNLQLYNEDEICIITDEKKISINLDLGDIKIIYFKKTFIKKLMFSMSEFIKKNRFISRNYTLNPFQKFLKTNQIDLIIFTQPSFYSLYCDGVQFVINIWNTEIKKHYNLNEFISGGYEYQNRIINFSVEKAFKIIVFTEKNKKDLYELYGCRKEKIVIQNLTPILPNIYKRNKNKDYLKIFNNLNLNSNFKWFFYPAQFWPHKNHRYLLDVMKELNKNNNQNIGFVFCGPDKGNLSFIKEIIKEENLSDHIKILGFINDEEIISLYLNCAAVIVPTLLGRSSLPLLESLFFKKKIFYSSGVLDDKLKNYVEEFDLDNPSDLSIKLLNYINKNESKFNEIDYQTEFNENKFKKNYEFIINDYRNLLKKWRAI